MKDCREIYQKAGPAALLDALQPAEVFPVAANGNLDCRAYTFEEPQPAAQSTDGNLDWRAFVFDEPGGENPPPPPFPPPAQAPAGVDSPLDRFRVDHELTLGLTWQEIEDLRPAFVIDNFIRRGELLLLGAESKSRKSWLAQDAGLCVATGTPWLADETGQDGFAVNAGRVWVVDLELAGSEVAYRFAKARGNRWPRDIEAQRRATASFTTFSLDGMGAVEILIMLDELQPRLAPGDLVIVDCFYRLQPDGNEAAEVALALERLKRLASETGAAVILVDHFRKASDDRARNRFAGSFIKQASAATLVAVEVRNDILEMNIDARTFHGCPKVCAVFDLESYRFVRVPEVEAADRKANKEAAEGKKWIAVAWHGRHPDAPITAADAGEAWRLSRQAATTRLDKLVERGFVAAHDRLPGASRQWSLNAQGTATLAPLAP